MYVTKCVFIATSVISFCGYNIQYIQIYHKIKILRDIDHMYMTIHLVQPINKTTWPYISCKIENKKMQRIIGGKQTIR